MKAILISLGLCTMIAVVAVELGVRYLIVPRDFQYIRIDKNNAPFFRLADTYDEYPVYIQEGRHEKAKRGDRDKRVAFIGDSVTFCANVRLEDCFVERLQTKQSVFDAYNYGVPGYSLSHMEKVLEKVLADRPVDLIVYTFNFNDIHSAAPVLLTLMETEKDRIVALEDYQGTKGKIKSLLRRYYQTPLVLNYFYSMLSAKTTAAPQVLAAGTGSSSTPSPASATSRNCFGEMQKASEGYLYRTLYPLWQQIYADPTALQALANSLKRLRIKAAQKGTKLLVVASYDFPIVEKNNQLLPATFREVAMEAGLDTLDLYPLFVSNYKTCDMYSDPGHPGKLGYRLMASSLLPAILDRLYQPNPSTRTPSP